MKKSIKVIIIALLVIFGIVGGVLIRQYAINIRYKDCYTIREAAHLFSYINMAGGGDIQADLPDLYDGVGDEEPITAADAKTVLEYFDMDYKDVGFHLDKMKDNKSLRKSEFTMLFDFIVDNKPNAGIKKSDMFIMDIKDVETNGDDETLITQMAVTGTGEYYIDTDIDREDMDKVLSVYECNGTIISNRGESKDGKVTIDNAWIEGIDGSEITFFYSDVHKTLKCDNSVKDVAADSIADISIDNDGITAVTMDSEVVSGKVLAITGEQISIEGVNEPLSLDDNYKIYKIYGELSTEKTAKILIGYSTTDFVVKDNVIQAALITEAPKAENIRIILNTTDYQALIHKEVSISSDSEITVTDGGKNTSTIAPEEVTKITTDSSLFGSGDRIVLSTAVENGRIRIDSITRNMGTPAYRGNIEIAKTDDGLYVINELPLEEYLYGVVVSEVPYTYNVEALKAQAICARGYAYAAMLDNERFAMHGAHLDDSVSSQVYNNTIENDATTFAVKDTYGMVPTYNGAVISPFFFSTSCGTSCNNYDVWGGTPSSYLTDTMQTLTCEAASLSDNDDFQLYMENAEVTSTMIEKACPFFRWNATYTVDEMSAVVNANLKTRMEANPEYFRSINAEGDFVREAVATIGKITDISIDRRGNSGIVLEMTIKGTENSIKIMGQNNARAIFSPAEAGIVKQDGSVTTGWSSLPSAFYYITTDSENFTIHGGGFGHGVGMSQNGANILAGMGYDAEYILAHYYYGIGISNIYTATTDILPPGDTEATTKATTEEEGKDGLNTTEEGATTEEDTTAEAGATTEAATTESVYDTDGSGIGVRPVTGE